MTLALKWAGLGMFGVGLLAAGVVLARVPVLPAPTLGGRGVARREAMESGGLFAMVEPLVRMVGSWVSHFSTPKFEQHWNEKLIHAGRPNGLDANELVASSLLSGIGLGVVGIAVANMVESGPLIAMVLSAAGFYVPFARVSQSADMRFTSVSRGLPAAIDLAAMCMGAGLDFPAAIRQIVDKSGRKQDPIATEFGRILQQLELGRTRKDALMEFRDRVPTESVIDFVGSVVQAEEKGTPLVEALQIQANMLRMRRTVRAEEAAAKAGVKMMAPLMLLFVCIMILVMGPMLLVAMAEW